MSSDRGGSVREAGLARLSHFGREKATAHADGDVGQGGGHVDWARPGGVRGFWVGRRVNWTEAASWKAVRVPPPPRLLCGVRRAGGWGECQEGLSREACHPPPGGAAAATLGRVNMGALPSGATLLCDQTSHCGNLSTPGVAGPRGDTPPPTARWLGTPGSGQEGATEPFRRLCDTGVRGPACKGLT